MPTDRSTLSLLVSTILLASVSSAAWSAQKIVPAQSEVAFTSKQMGVPVQGRFERFDGQINVDPARPETGRVAFTVDLGSAAIGTAETATELKKPEWFDVGRFPTASFQSTALKSLGPGKVDVVGMLTIKGIAKEIHVPMTLAQQGDALKAGGDFTVRRFDYRIGAGEWGDTGLVADEVLVHVRLTVQGSPTP